jgi:sirohydrochlorin cobaltochelatase
MGKSKGSNFTMTETVIDKRAPMASAPMKYRDDGEVDWGDMWDTFCVLALDGGPPHRGTMLYAQEEANTTTPAYQQAVREIIRGIHEVSQLHARPDKPGWMAVQCDSVAHAKWVAEAIREENIQTRSEGTLLFVPVGDYFTVKGEIKNVITAVAKTTHYWIEHLPPDVKRTLALQAQLSEVRATISRWMGR